MKEGSTLSFIDLIEEVDCVQIPILQRDYAQGREEASEVRRQFLGSIKQALLPNHITQPLDLDFVYGNFEGPTRSSFSVLDGQQRLTTLFLLHWYLATKEGYVTSFQESFVFKGSSKFTYRTRVSATEFFNALVTSEDVFFDNKQHLLSDLIIDKQWFFLSWKSDPTVQACLTMLDAMHEQFIDCEDLLYERLVDKVAPRIIFQYLNLESFGLSDELYIKMNARGKPLSDFENFKAWLCGQLEKKPRGKQIEKKIDQEWTDIFWKISRESENDFDELYLRFFNLMAFYRACERVEGGFELLDQPWKTWLQNLRTATGHVFTDDFGNFNSFDKRSLRRVELVLDYFFAHLTNDDTRNILKDAVTSDTFVNQAKFYAFVKFIEKAGELKDWTRETETNQERWSRVTDNLINNHRIDELTSFIPSIRSLAKLSAHDGNLYEFLESPGMSSGFTKAQREEESLKARLILSDEAWEALLIRYESHPYLQGKVGFLLEIATDATEGNICPEKFEKFGDKVSVLLSQKMLRSEEFLLQRALLALGDYLVQDSGFRYSFCLPNQTFFRERSENWLAVVKKPVFTKLLRKVGKNVDASLRKIIENVDCGGWRQLVVEHPEVIRYCRQRLIHKENNDIYLLSKSTRRGYHAELRTFILDSYLMEMDDRDELPDEISEYDYVPVYGYDSAYVWIELNNEDVYNVYYEDGAFSAWDDSEDQVPLEMPTILINLISEMLPAEVVE